MPGAIRSLQSAFDHGAIDDFKRTGHALVDRAFTLEQPLPNARELLVELAKISESA